MRGKARAARVSAIGILVLAIGLARAREAHANGPEVIDTGACLVPVTKSAIHLAREYVTVRVPKDNGLGGSVDCRYVLENPSAKAVELTMAFVVGAEGRLAVVAGMEDSGFDVRANGKRVPVRLQAVREEDWTDLIAYPPDSLPCWKVRMPAHGELDLRIGYQVWWDVSRADGLKGFSSLRYHALAARLWSGSIETASIEFDLTNAGGRYWRCVFDPNQWGLGRLSPDGYSWMEDTVKWEFHDWIPDVDFEVQLPYACAK